MSYQVIRERVKLIYEETPGQGAKRLRAQLDENPKNDVARDGLAIAQIKGGQLNEARENLKQLLVKSPNESIHNLAQVDLEINRNKPPDTQAREIGRASWRDRVRKEV